MKLKILIIFICLSFWPTSLFLVNTFSDFIHYLVPTLFLICFYLLYKKNIFLYSIPLLAIPFFDPKLALIPVLFFAINSILERNKLNLISLIVSLLIVGVLFFQFRNQTVFYPDHNAYQKVIQETRLYDSILEARVFHNKARVYLDRIDRNFFALIDINNYFTGFHPREITVDNQNLKKFPTFSIFFMIFTLLNLKKLKSTKIIFTLLVASLINISLLSVFDRTDFILYLPFSLLIINGVNLIASKHSLKTNLLFIFFILISSVEYLKIFVDNLK
jgi:hypothetical protein